MVPGVRTASTKTSQTWVAEAAGSGVAGREARQEAAVRKRGSHAAFTCTASCRLQTRGAPRTSSRTPATRRRTEEVQSSRRHPSEYIALPLLMSWFTVASFRWMVRNINCIGHTDSDTLHNPKIRQDRTKIRELGIFILLDAQ